VPPLPSGGSAPRHPRPKRRAVYLAATACAAVLAIVLGVTAFGGGGTPGITYVQGNADALIYATGHRQLAPGFSGTTLTGTQVSSASYRGKILLLNFWGSWCPPCRSEAGTLAVIAEQYQPLGVAFLGVDVRDTKVGADAFIVGHSITYPSLNDSNSAILLSFNSMVPTTPTTLVIDKTGRIAGAVVGEATYPELNAILSKVSGTSS
jgi:peroxiredoxin